jgi:hypothetical protein
MTSKYEKELFRIDRMYDSRVTELAERVRRDLVIPFCERYAVDFSAGMGSWSFHGTGKIEGNYLSDSQRERGMPKLPKRLANALQLQVYNGQELGSVIDSYDIRIKK